MELELKHIAPYAPYDLKWSLQGLKTFTMNGITTETLYTQEGTVFNWNKHNDLPQALFPILRPLSDILESGYHFIYDQETDFQSILDWVDLDTESRFSAKFSYDFWQLLFENHFDLFGLIDQGLAINMNTLNP